MLTTRDILQRTDGIHLAWTIGMKEDSMTREEIMATNISRIAETIIMQENGIMFHLSGVLLKGVVRIYSKKTIFVLNDCSDIIAKISLKTKPNEDNIQGNNKEKENIPEIDKETLELWKREVNLEKIIDEEKEEGMSLITEFVIPERFQKENVQSPPTIENDFGEVPFELTFGDDNSDTNYHYQNEDEHSQPPNLNIEFHNAPKEFSKLIIDQSPIIPMTELSYYMDNPNLTLCNRPIIKRNQKIRIENYRNDFEELFNEAKKIGMKFEMEKQKTFDLPDLPVKELPELPDPRIHEIPNDQNEFEREEEEIKNNILPVIEEKFSYCDQINILDLVLERNRRNIAASFYELLSLKNQGKIDLIQNSQDEPIFIIKS